MKMRRWVSLIGGVLLLGGFVYVGSHLEFEDPFKPAPIFKGISMSPEEIKDNPMKAVSLTEEAAKLQYKVFEKLIKILEAHHIDYWITCGTLLGAVRHEGVIPFDDDIDTSIEEKDTPRIFELKKALKEAGLGIYQDRTSIKIYQLDGYNVRPKRKSFRIFSGVWFVRRKVEKFPCIDIFPTMEKNGEIIHANPRALRVFPKEIFQEGDIHPLKEYQFGPLRVKGPHNALNFLNSTYGKEWDKYIVFGSNHNYSTDIKFKLLFTEELKKSSYRYGTLPE